MGTNQIQKLKSDIDGLLPQTSAVPQHHRMAQNLLISSILVAHGCRERFFVPAAASQIVDRHDQMFSDVYGAEDATQVI